MILGQVQTFLVALKGFNNPKYTKIKQLLSQELALDLDDGFRLGAFTGRDKQFLDQIVLNRHRNVHATEDSSTWFISNNKDLRDFKNEFQRLIQVVLFIDAITYNENIFEFSQASSVDIVYKACFSLNY